MDIARLDLNLLLVFHAVYEEGSVTLAAKRLKISQPTVSFSLKKLRELFHDELFVRQGNGMRPTPFADNISETVRQVIRLVQDNLLIERDFDPLRTERTFSFSMSDIGELVFLPPLMEALRTEAPNARLRCLSMQHDELYEALANGTVDLALGYFPDLAHHDIYQQRLFNHRFNCILRKDHPIQGDHLSLEQFMAADHAVVSEKGRSQEIAERQMNEMGLQRRIVLQSPHFMSIPLIVAHSDFITIVPKALGQAYAKQANLRLVEPPFEIPEIELKQFWHRRVQNDLSITWLRALIARLFLRNDPTNDEMSPIFGSGQSNRGRVNEFDQEKAGGEAAD